MHGLKQLLELMMKVEDKEKPLTYNNKCWLNSNNNSNLLNNNYCNNKEIL